MGVGEQRARVGSRGGQIGGRGAEGQSGGQGGGGSRYSISLSGILSH